MPAFTLLLHLFALRFRCEVTWLRNLIGIPIHLVTAEIRASHSCMFMMWRIALVARQGLAPHATSCRGGMCLMLSPAA